MQANTDLKWSIVQIKLNSYELAKRNLERQGFGTFLPEMDITIRKNNKFIFKKVYVFPGYIFVSFDPKFVDWTKINSTYGVSKIIAFNNKPAEISKVLILELKNRYNFNYKISENNNLQKGDNIKIHNGPFVDLIAKVESVDKNNRIWVLLEYAGAIKKINLQHNNNNKIQYNKL